MSDYQITWTKVDEAPALASYCLLPVVEAFTKPAGIKIGIKDISLAGRILATFPEYLKEDQKITDDLNILGDMVKIPEANVIKLPNISASIPQLKAAVKELQEQGFAVPDYPEDPKSGDEKKLHARFQKLLGSAVNPVLREGNSDRRPADAVKRFANKYPHKMMKVWPESGSIARVAHMTENDFYGSEISHTLPQDDSVSIILEETSGEKQVLKENLSLLKGEIIDTAVMNAKSLREFYAKEIKSAKDEGALLSLHLKATMMKVSDPIMFGHAVSVYFAEALEKHADTLKSVGANVNNGLADVLAKLDKLPAEKKTEIENDINTVYKNQPSLAMVDSRNGITNLHKPNDVIIDASMPNVIRDGGKMWNKNDELQDTVAMIPDRSYATMYAEILEDAKKNGQFDPSKMGNVANVGLMAKKAEEYGSHDKTFNLKTDGIVKVINSSGEVLLEQQVERGDIFRMCQTKDEAVKDWVGLAVKRAKSSGSPTVFWLDENRGHDAEIIMKVNTYLKDFDTDGLEIKILAPVEAMRFTLQRVRAGKNTISVTGNVLRDYLTDLFPILELGTSSRMLSIVPLLNGGGLFETGAGGSAPKHVQQMEKEGHLRWDSLGEYCAIVPSLELAADKTNNDKAKVLAAALDDAIGNYLENGKLPSRKVNELDNRGSTFYLTLYWAEALANQDKDESLKSLFSPVFAALEENEAKINEELLAAQGKPANLGGYFHPIDELAGKAMRPSETLNKIIDNI
ncbi:MAG: isocitrate dehydrogenase [Melioribacteraceae bacterium]|nr:MAG: isocitrate dehydrogenase [Melioribacteraceae bacterium]